VLAALHLTEPSTEGLRNLSTEEWKAALDYCDQHRLTLPLRDAAREAMPTAVQERVDNNAASYGIRLEQFIRLYAEINRRLSDSGLEFVILKGAAAAQTLGIDASSRVQYDLDIYLPREGAFQAQEMLSRSGWKPVKEMEGFPTDHLPVLLPEAEWKWRGDYFDTSLPIPIEIHFRFWAEEIERLPAQGVEEFWTRRRTAPVGNVQVGVLAPADALGYAVLHLLRHVLRGDVRVFHVYEIACVLRARSGDSAFWSEWRTLHSPELRRLEAVVFRLAHEWFGCPVPETEPLPEAADHWFGMFATSPATQEFHPNKDHLWLHIGLLDSAGDAWSVARRRLLPGNLPPRARRGQAGFWTEYAARTASRLRHHAIALPKTGISGLRFWLRVNGLGRQYWLFLASAALFNLPLFAFFLHYNLFLLELGYREDFVGTVNSAMRMGSMAGTIPAAVIAQQQGLRRTLIWTVLATSAAEVLRGVAGTRLPLAGLAFVSGCVFAVWAVIMAPLVAASVPEKGRTTAFSLFFSSLIALGVIGNWIGGALPLWLGSKRAVILFAGAASALAVLPALWLREFPATPSGSRIYPRNRFLFLYLSAFAVWHLATGLFNPFNNVYLKRAGYTDQGIGSTFAISQAFQAAALLLAPLLLRRFGLLNGIGLMMLATACGLGLLATQPAGLAAGTAYIAYMGFQWMSEPGLNTLLMNRIGEQQRSGASALNYVVAFGCQALAAWAGGAVFSRFGYGPGLATAAGLALLAGLLFRVLLPARPGTDPA
jgi:predicted MFS family arabinose efflux permease